MNPVINQMTSFIVMDVLEKAQSMEKMGINVIHMEVGEPDFEVPRCVADEIHVAANSGQTHYTHSLGDYELREEIARFYMREYNTEVDPDCIMVTSGSSPAILMVLMTLCGVGDEVMISNPGYPCYRNFILSCHANPVEIPLYAASGFQFNVNDVIKLKTDKTRAIFVNSPMNPCGVLVNDSVYESLAQTGIPIISDEIYHGLVYQGKTRSVLEFTKNAFVINGFSKRFAMTGLRLGYIIAPKEYMRTLQILQQNLFICAPSISQKAAIKALTGSSGEVESMKNIYNQRRLYMIERLKSIGFGIETEPQGAFYIFADASRFTNNSYQFAFEVLEHAHVGITPGIDFGSRGEGFVRFSYANSLENLKEGLNRLEKYCLGLRDKV